MGEIEEDVLVRWVIRRDLEQVADIEHRCFSDPWTKKTFLDYIQKNRCFGCVAVIDSQVLGYIFYEVKRNKVEIDSIAVDPEFHRKGIGTMLLAKIRASTNHRNKDFVTVVKESNLAALAFFRDAGFIAIQRLHKPYDNSDDDGYKMEFSRSTLRIDLRNRITDRKY